MYLQMMYKFNVKMYKHHAIYFALRTYSANNTYSADRIAMFNLHLNYLCIYLNACVR